jgi:UbiD family decarboxylase
MLPQLGELTRSFPKTVSAKEAACKQVILRDNFNLLDFPVLTCWPHDGGPFITLPCVHTRDPKSGKRNIGMYRMQVYDGQTTGMHWQRQKVAAEHYREACAEPQLPIPMPTLLPRALPRWPSLRAERMRSPTAGSEGCKCSSAISKARAWRSP